MKFKIQPSMYCPEGEWYLLCSPKDSSDVDNIIRSLQQVLDRLNSREYTLQGWDSLYGIQGDTQ